MELIPAIDLRDGRCVRLYKGDFAAETVYSDDPQSVLEKYRALGARRVHVVDLDGARDGAQANRAAIVRLAQQRQAALQVGGGLRSLERVRALLSDGVDRAVVGSVAVTAPDQVMAWIRDVDAERLVLALDVRIDASGAPMLTTHGWRETSTVTLWSAVERFAKAELATSFARISRGTAHSPVRTANCTPRPCDASLRCSGRRRAESLPPTISSPCANAAWPPSSAARPCWKTK